jgi:hypothetical protein
VRPAIEALFDRGAVFADGRREAFDAIVAATGYRTALERVLATPEAIASDGRPRFPSGQQTPLRGLYFLGYGDTTRGAIYEANRDAQRLAAVIGRDLS